MGRILTLRIPEKLAQFIDAEASMEGIDAAGVLQRGLMATMIVRTAMAEMSTHFPADAEMNYSIFIEACAGDIVKCFEVNPLTPPGEPRTRLIEEDPGTGSI